MSSGGIVSVVINILSGGGLQVFREGRIFFGKDSDSVRV